jgi:hypothetical protein
VEVLVCPEALDFRSDLSMIDEDVESLVSDGITGSRCGVSGSLDGGRARLPGEHAGSKPSVSM